MGTIRFSQLAKELKIKNKELLDIARELNLNLTSNSYVDEADANLIREYVQNKNEGVQPKLKKKVRKKKKKVEQPEQAVTADSVGNIESEAKKEAEEKGSEKKEEPSREEVEKVEEAVKEQSVQKGDEKPDTDVVKKDEEEKVISATKEEIKPEESGEEESEVQKIKIISMAPSDTAVRKERRDESTEEPVKTVKDDESDETDTKEEEKHQETKGKKGKEKFDDEESFHPRKRIVVKKKKKKRVDEELFEDDKDIDLSKAVEEEEEIKKKSKKQKKKHVFVKSKKPKRIKIGEKIQIKDLAQQLGEKAIELYKKVKEIEPEVEIDDYIDFDTVSLVLADYNVEFIREIVDEKELLEIEEDREEDLVPRPPVVTVMGHVDHGKTTLLDSIRKTRVADKEAGGITQDIGASVVDVKGKGKIVFIDTPGHEAFTSMRARGAMVTDIVILVVAANDGVMPQTEESISHANAAGVPIVVAINKVDLPDANVDKVKKELSNKGLIPEEWGGSTLMAEISAKKGTGIDDLLEMVLLQAELLELKANPKRRANGIIIRTSLDPHIGPVATTIVRNGTLKVKDIVVAGTSSGRVRALIDHNGKRVKSAPPSYPVEIMGLDSVPEEGEEFYVVKNDSVAKKIVEIRKNKLKDEKKTEQKVLTLENFFELAQQNDIHELNLILKAESTGAVDALKKGLLKFDNDEVKVNIVHTGVGKIAESDVTLALASKAIIIGFNVRPDNNAMRLAKAEKVEIYTSSIIYELLDTIKAALEGMLSPEQKEVINGRAEVRNTFNIPKVGTIAGCYVTDGFIYRKDKVRVIRDGVVVYEGNIASLKRFKDDVSEVKAGYECGIGIEKFNDVKVGDLLESFALEDVKKTLE